jgi:hypothetical protein
MARFRHLISHPTRKTTKWNTFTRQRTPILKQNESKIDVKLNIMADKLANEAIQGSEIQEIKTNTFRIIIDEKSVFKTKDIKEYCAESTSKQYMINKYGQEAYNNINWTLLQRINIKYFKYSSVIKMINSLALTKRKLFKQQRSNTPKCLLCRQNQEMDHHVLICRKNPENYTEKIEKIQKHAGLKNTNIKQMKNLIGKISQENNNEDNDLNKDQKQIRWKRILQAKVATSFQKWIQTQLNRIISQKATENLIFAIIEQWQ